MVKNSYIAKVLSHILIIRGDIMKNKDFLKGLIYGVIFTLIVSLVLNTGCILFRRFVTKEINYEAKAKSYL
mgnify:FL=1